MAELVDIVLTKSEKNNEYADNVYFKVKKKNEILYFKSNGFCYFPQEIKENAIAEIERLGYVSLIDNLPEKITTLKLVPVDKSKAKQTVIVKRLGLVERIRNVVTIVPYNNQFLMLQNIYNKWSQPLCMENHEFVKTFVGLTKEELKEIEKNYRLSKFNLNKLNKSEFVKQISSCFCSSVFVIAVNNFTQIKVGTIKNTLAKQQTKRLRWVNID